MGAGAAAGLVLPVRPSVAGPSSGGVFGPLQAPDTNGVALPEGFTSRVIATTGEPVGDTDHAWHAAPDGGACFPTDDGGWVYVSNSEMPGRVGGAGAVRFGPDGRIVDAYSILDGTSTNCAGGPTPWGTWLSCEEFDLHGADPALIEGMGGIAGRVWECDPFAAGTGTVRPALGAFQHEAVAVDPDHGRLYLTEDRPDGLLYRFTPEAYPNLEAGLLEAASVDGGRVRWVEVPDPAATEAPPSQQLAGQVTPFAGGEGIWFHDGAVVFTTKGTDQVYVLRTADDTLDVLYDAATLDAPPLTGVDNITADASGDLYVAEDGGNMELVHLSWEGVASPFLRIDGHEGSEVTGPAFSPDGTRLYLSSQRGVDGAGVGVTYEIAGPFRGAATPSTTRPPSPSTTLANSGSDQAAAAGSDDGDAVPLALVGGGVVAVGAVAAGLVALRRRGSTSQ